MIESLETHSESETAETGKRIASRLKAGDVVALYGELGAGKTHLIQGMCRALGVRGHVSSPTFTIVNEYDTGSLQVYHFDFYRIDSMEEIIDLGFEEYLDRNGICFIEWAEKAQPLLPPRRVDIRMGPGTDEHSRTIAVDAMEEERP